MKIFPQTGQKFTVHKTLTPPKNPHYTVYCTCTYMYWHACVYASTAVKMKCWRLFHVMLYLMCSRGAWHDQRVSQGGIVQGSDHSWLGGEQSSVAWHNTPGQAVLTSVLRRAPPNDGTENGLLSTAALDGPTAEQSCAQVYMYIYNVHVHVHCTCVPWTSTSTLSTSGL